MLKLRVPAAIVAAILAFATPAQPAEYHPEPGLYPYRVFAIVVVEGVQPAYIQSRQLFDTKELCEAVRPSLEAAALAELRGAYPGRGVGIRTECAQDERVFNT